MSSSASAASAASSASSAPPPPPPKETAAAAAAAAASAAKPFSSSLANVPLVDLLPAVDLSSVDASVFPSHYATLCARQPDDATANGDTIPVGEARLALLVALTREDVAASMGKEASEVTDSEMSKFASDVDTWVHRAGFLGEGEERNGLYVRAAKMGHCVALAFAYELGLDEYPRDDKVSVALFTIGARCHDLRSMTQLGEIYEYGNDAVEKDTARAAELFRRASEKQHPAAQTNYADMLTSGVATADGKPDVERAVALYRAAANAGDPIARATLGQLLIAGEHCERDVVGGVEMLKQAVETGDPVAKSHLAEVYLRGDEGVEANPSEALRLFREAAELKESSALVSLGCIYEEGSCGVEQDLERAVEYLQIAAKNGDSMAINKLGDFTFYGMGGLEASPEGAVELYRQAAEKGLIMAKCNLGDCLRDGTGVKRDRVEALRLYEEAAEAGDAIAMANLGLLYSRGAQGVKKDPKKAFSYYMKAADLGDVEAKNNLASCYSGGIGVRAQHDKAFELYREAAIAGNSTAQSNLGDCYWEGIGTTRNRDKAVAAYKMACANENKLGAFNLGQALYSGVGQLKKDAHLAAAFFLASDMDKGSKMLKKMPAKDRAAGTKIWKQCKEDLLALTQLLPSSIDEHADEFTSQTTAKTAIQTLNSRSEIIVDNAPVKRENASPEPQRTKKIKIEDQSESGDSSSAAVISDPSSSSGGAAPRKGGKKKKAPTKGSKTPTKGKPAGKNIMRAAIGPRPPKSGAAAAATTTTSTKSKAATARNNAASVRANGSRSASAGVRYNVDDDDEEELISSDDGDEEDASSAFSVGSEDFPMDEDDDDEDASMGDSDSAMNQSLRALASAPARRAAPAPAPAAPAAAPAPAPPATRRPPAARAARTRAAPAKRTGKGGSKDKAAVTALKKRPPPRRTKAGPDDNADVIIRSDTDLGSISSDEDYDAGVVTVDGAGARNGGTKRGSSKPGDSDEGSPPRKRGRGAAASGTPKAPKATPASPARPSPSRASNKGKEIVGMSPPRPGKGKGPKASPKASPKPGAASPATAAVLDVRGPIDMVTLSTLPRLANVAPSHALTTSALSGGGPTFLSARYLNSLTDDFSADRLVARGAFGDVYTAVDATSGQRLAVHVFDASDELKTLKKLSTRLRLMTSTILHPAMRPMIGYGLLKVGNETNDSHLALVYAVDCHGTVEELLRDDIAAANFSIEHRVGVLVQLATLLSWVYRAKATRTSWSVRNLQSSEVTVGPGNRAQLMTGGLSYLVGSGSINTCLERTSRLSPTAVTYSRDCGPTYVNMFVIEEPVSQASDLTRDMYALGIIILEMLSGKTSTSPESVRAGGKRVGNVAELIEPFAAVYDSGDGELPVDERCGAWPKFIVRTLVGLALDCTRGTAAREGLRADAALHLLTAVAKTLSTAAAKAGGKVLDEHMPSAEDFQALVDSLSNGDAENPALACSICRRKLADSTDVPYCGATATVDEAVARGSHVACDGCMTQHINQLADRLNELDADLARDKDMPCPYFGCKETVRAAAAKPNANTKDAVRRLLRAKNEHNERRMMSEEAPGSPYDFRARFLTLRACVTCPRCVRPTTGSGQALLRKCQNNDCGTAFCHACDEDLGTMHAGLEHKCSTAGAADKDKILEFIVKRGDAAEAEAFLRLLLPYTRAGGPTQRDAWVTAAKEYGIDESLVDAAPADSAEPMDTDEATNKAK